MPKYEKFEDLPVWQEAVSLHNSILDLLDEQNLPFAPGFRNKLDRAALSVPNSIAEEFERVTTDELTAFLAIARGSAGEVRSMIAAVKGCPQTQTVRAPPAGNSCTGRAMRATTHSMDQLDRGFAGAGQAAFDAGSETAA